MPSRNAKLITEDLLKKGKTTDNKKGSTQLPRMLKRNIDDINKTEPSDFKVNDVREVRGSLHRKIRGSNPLHNHNSPSP